LRVKEKEKSVWNRLIRWRGGESPNNPQGSLEGSLDHQEVALESPESVGEEKERIWMKGYGRLLKYP
jgi:hypothetical protein